MTDETNKMNTLIAACWKDDALKQRFLSDPHAVLAEHGMDVPEGMNVNVVENTDNAVHVTLPAAPEGHAELSDEELESAAGGTFFVGGTAFLVTVGLGAVEGATAVVLATGLASCFK
jgi:hypothetical protein